MKCDHCGVEYSDSVWSIHVNVCSGKKEHKEVVEQVEIEQTKEAFTEEQIRAKAKEFGIKKWHVKSIENLISEMGV